ncbi:hypothetical protein G647_01823 [Cladophialophora carrionii CBS 160.54]|uniref:Major facilitator superfamily (MFS) profile domain-containing protein n=1 Tax=Cladophialophora carrionii CBS 160.54 TaxID=1279043 RepID=V9DR49_9EURO|nr:uncharacterized protein G647_01823 [Cladophialophora carrionii CBS 160.54]ETI29370.1 hypothetical protein G647_01823 [Cladophialophora carrionii CBS 160.54]
MSMILRPFTWFYHEFGIVSIHETGRNAWLIILARSCRMFAYGTNSLILAIFFSALNYSDHQIGIFMTLTLLGDVFLGTFLTLIADRVGRRRVLMGGSVLMIISGLVFAVFENFWILLLAAILGVISVTGGDFGPFRSIEESVLSQLTTPTTRADVLAWYVTTSTLGSSIGSEVSGRLIHYLQARPGWTDVDAYHSLFWIYLIMGIVNVLFVLLLTDACELRANDKGEEMYSRVPQEDHNRHEDDNDEAVLHHQLQSNPNGTAEADVEAASPPPTPSPTRPRSPQPSTIPSSRLSRALSAFSSALSQISETTRRTMYKLWFLLVIDSLADGMVPYSLTNYYMDVKFHPSKSTLGDVTSLSYFLGAIGAVFAGPLARKIGLINTMVFTHVPSSTAVLLFPLAPYFWITALFLLVRTGLNNMDQAPRSAFIAAVVKPEERTAVMGITSMLRNLAAMCGPTVTGVLAEGDRFGVAFIAAGVCRLVYDFGLYALFVGYERGRKLQDRRDDEDDDEEGVDDQRGFIANGQRHGQGHRRDIPDDTGGADAGHFELESLADSEDSDGSDNSNDRKTRESEKAAVAAAAAVTGPITTTTTTATLNGGLRVPLGSGESPRVRSRSPHHRSSASE